MGAEAARKGHLTFGAAPRVYEPKIEEAVQDGTPAPLDATWATRTWVPLVLNGNGTALVGA